jgi:hypothetical protein
MLRRQTGVQEQVVAIRSFGADEKKTLPNASFCKTSIFYA